MPASAAGLLTTTPPQFPASGADLPECNSTRRRSRWAEPEIVFRIVHVTLDGRGGPAYREQTVEVALGPKPRFENATLATLTRRVPADRVVTAVPERPRRRWRPKRARKPRTPSVVRLLRKALEWRRQLDAGEVRSQAEIARREGLTRARITQIMGLLRLSPAIRDYILAMPDTAGRPPISEPVLRRIVRIADGAQQEATFFSWLADGFEATAGVIVIAEPSSRSAVQATPG